MPLNPGQVLHNRYRIDSLLGQGGMGAVYRAYDLTLNRPCALKEMVPPPGLGAAEVAQLRQQFHQEASTLASLSHPNLPRVTDYFNWGDGEILVMDYVEGDSLAARIEHSGGRGLAERQVLNWADQLFDALAYCHSQGVIHRDLKPPNIIITHQGRAMLVDFGLVKLWNPSDPRTMTVLRGIGTPAYAPPEQYVAGAGHTDGRSDIYALGGTLYHALTGQEPPPAHLRMADPRSFVAPRTLRPDLSPRTEAVILKAMALDRAQRFQSIGEMKAALAGTGAGPVAVSRPSQAAFPSSQTVPVSVGTGPAVAQRTRAWAWAAAGALAVLLTMAGVYWLVSRQPSPTPTPPGVAVVSPVPTNTPKVKTPVPPPPTEQPPTEPPLTVPPPTEPPPTVPPPTEIPTVAPPSRAELEQSLLAQVRWHADNAVPVFAYYTNQPPIMDGFLDEWTTGAYAVADLVNQSAGNWTGPDDCSGRFYVAWDDNNLYLGIEVWDDQHVQESSGRLLYKGDDIEIQLDVDLLGDYDKAELDDDDGQVGLTASDFLGSYEAYVWRPPSLESPISVLMGVRQTPGGYVLEAALPWTALNLYPRTEFPYGFCLSLADDDSAGTAGQEIMVSNAPRRRWGDPTTWGTLILVDW